MIYRQCVAFLDPQPAGECLLQFTQRRDAARIAFDRRHPRSGAQQGAGQPAGAGPDLQHRPVSQRPRHGSDPVEQILVEQEVLAQRLRCAEAMAGDNLAQRGQAHSAARCTAASAAIFIAAMVAPGLAAPVPAMAKAVP